MAGARKDDLMIVSRDGVDYKATVAQIKPAVSELPELPAGGGGSGGDAPEYDVITEDTEFVTKGEGFMKLIAGLFNIQNDLSSNNGWSANCNTGLVELVNIPEGALFCCPCYNEVRNGFDIDKTNSFTAESWAGSASFEVKIGGQTIIKMTDWFLNQVGHGYHNYAFNMPAEPVKGRLSVSASWSRVHGKIEGEVKLPIYVQPPGVNAEFLYKEGDANKIMNEWVQGDHNEGDLFLVTVGGEDGMHGTESQWGGDIIVYDSPGKIKSKTGDVIELPETFRSQDFCEVHFHRLDEKGLIAVGFTPVTDCLAWAKA